VRESEALRIAQSVLAELEAGVRPFASAENVPWQSAATPADAAERDRWMTSVLLGSGPLDGLASVRVVVALEPPATQPLVKVELAKWMPDPSVSQETDSTSSQNAASSSTGATAGGSSSDAGSQGSSQNAQGAGT
jgi:hypothetical protein